MDKKNWRISDAMEPGGGDMAWFLCGDCNGEGVVEGAMCEPCCGTGLIPKQWECVINSTVLLNWTDKQAWAACPSPWGHTWGNLVKETIICGIRNGEDWALDVRNTIFTALSEMMGDTAVLENA